MCRNLKYKHVTLLVFLFLVAMRSIRTQTSKTFCYKYNNLCCFFFAGKFLEDIHQVEDSRLSAVSREITDSRVKTQEESDALYQKMISYILLRSRMGSPTDVNAVQETTGFMFTRSHSQSKYSDSGKPAGVQGKEHFHPFLQWMSQCP